MIITLPHLIEHSHRISREHGWWPTKNNCRASHDGDVCPTAEIDLSQVNVPEKIALMHSELSEALEEYRNDDLPIYYNDDGKPEGIAIELADVLIRIGDFCGAYGIDLNHAVEVKLAYNETRPFRHGGKKA